MPERKDMPSTIRRSPKRRLWFCPTTVDGLVELWHMGVIVASCNGFRSLWGQGWRA
jgi:hypothetical protein